jgi:hypothetical protein
LIGRFLFNHSGRSRADGRCAINPDYFSDVNFSVVISKDELNTSLFGHADLANSSRAEIDRYRFDNAPVRPPFSAACAVSVSMVA